jgi:hypothetical protein
VRPPWVAQCSQRPVTDLPPTSGTPTGEEEGMHNTPQGGACESIYLLCTFGSRSHTVVLCSIQELVTIYPRTHLEFPACFHHFVTENSQGTKGEKDIHSHSQLLALLTCRQYPTRAYHCVEHFILCLLTLAIQVKTWTLLYMDPGMDEAAPKLLQVHRSGQMSEVILSNQLLIHTQLQGL